MDLACPYITDDHLHLDPRGRGLAAIKEFSKAGGTHLVLVHKPYHDSPGAGWTTGKEWLQQAQVTLDLAKQVRKESELAPGALAVVAAPHPAELPRLMERLGAEQGEQAYRSGLEAAASLADEHYINGLGEVGRPHYPVDEQVWAAANRTLSYALEMALEKDIAAVLHTESGTPEVMAELAQIAGKVGFPLDRLVKHYSGPLTTCESNSGLTVSVIASRTNLEAALQGDEPFMLETDYLDDPRRPGAVMGPKTVPRRTRDALQKGLMSENQAHQIHIEVPRRVYGLEYH